LKKAEFSFTILANEADDILTILKNNGLNTVRVRLWHSPKDEHSSFEEVKSFAQRIKSSGLKVLLTVHYSDTWADPGNQAPPLDWARPFIEAVRDSVYTYTSKIMNEINPDFIQIGNEINPGFLHPYGNINSNPGAFLELLAQGIKAVREHSQNTKIIIHFAGIEGVDWFFDQLRDIDYDIIGISYYPLWHGKDLDKLTATLFTIGKTYSKEVLIAETAYPFTLEWNDWTNNIVGLEEQLILPGFPATPEGQQEFISSIKEIVKSNSKVIGYCYWGAELVAYNGPQAQDGSAWENQAVFDFNNKALPVVYEFNFSN
jgi:arabinogalactan endo-1,4-beta-galactosidase